MVIIKRCGNEGLWPSNTPQQRHDRQFLQKGISFYPEAINEGADLANAAFVFCIPGRDFAVISGDHRWEFIFFEERGEIEVRCCRLPKTRWLWNITMKCWSRVVDYVRDIAFQGVTGRPYLSPPALDARALIPPRSQGLSSSIRGNYERDASFYGETEGPPSSQAAIHDARALIPPRSRGHSSSMTGNYVSNSNKLLYWIASPHHCTVLLKYAYYNQNIKQTTLMIN